MEYRKDIQILRGISVLLVVLYHLELAGFQNGFLGVDVFFIISGFLMAALYNPAHTRDFLVKRAKRLLPAYFVTILATLVLATIFVSPYEYGSVTQQALFGVTFLSNIGFWLENSYFSKIAFRPLLHLWSLGVEIQFYLTLPILAWFFKKIKWSYFVFLLGSLALCFFVLGISERTAFFMMPLRLWEFLIGYGIAKRFPKPAVAKESALRWLGLAFMLVLLCTSLLPVDVKVENFISGHPGIVALIVCLSTAGLLAFGLPPVVESLRISTILEKLGEYSYSIYLVHFPLIVLFLYQPFSGTVLHTAVWWQPIVLIALIIVLSLSLHHFVEKRFRINRKAFQLAASCAVAIVVLNVSGNMLQQFKYPEKEMFVYQAWTDRSEYRCGTMRRMIDPLGITCDITSKLTNPVYRVLLAGDSHADAIKTTFASVAESENVSVRFVVDNDPLLENGLTVAKMIEEAVKWKTNAIVLFYSHDNINMPVTQELVSQATQQGIAVVFIMPIPTWPDSAPKLLWKAMKFGQPLPAQTIQDYQAKYQALSADLSQIPSKKFRAYPVADLFCQAACVLTNAVGKPLYFDSSHLTLSGSELLRGRFKQIITDLKEGQ